MAKVLVGIPTYARGKDSLTAMLTSIESFGQPVDIIFAENSEHDDYVQFLRGQGFTVVKSESTGNRANKIIKARNVIRDYFLAGDWSHLFFLDSDVISPPHTLTALLSLNKACANGMYKLASIEKGQKVYLPDIWHWTEPEKITPGELHLTALVKQVSVADVAMPRKRKIAIAGLGCCLITREVLEQIAFTQYSEDDSGGEDFAFFLDLKRMGKDAWVDTSIKCFHQCFPAEDARNIPYQF